MQLDKLTATEAASLIRSERLRPRPSSRALLGRIAERDADVAAWEHLDPEARAGRGARGRSQATVRCAARPAARCARRHQGHHRYGEFADRERQRHLCRAPSGQDASVVTQLKAAGAVILGKTVTTELAFYGPGKTRNPHNLAHTPGGSSSGSAAAVADFQVPIALGTQTAGSIIRPASYCGVIGFKPTFGVVSRAGALEQSPPLDTIGGYARSIEDLALLIDAMSGADARDAGMGPRYPAPLSDALKHGTARTPRFAFVKTAALAAGRRQHEVGIREASSRRSARQSRKSLCRRRSTS